MEAASYDPESNLPVRRTLNHPLAVESVAALPDAKVLERARFASGHREGDIELDGEPVLVRIRAEPRGEEASEGASGGEEPVRGDENEWKGSGLSTHEGKSSGDKPPRSTA